MLPVCGIFLLLFEKGVKLVGGGSDITGLSRLVIFLFPKTEAVSNGRSVQSIVQAYQSLVQGTTQASEGRP